MPGTGVVVHAEASDKRAVTDRQQTVAYWMPWRVNKPIVTVRKQLYRKHPRPKAAARASRNYVGPNLELREVQSLEILDDVGEDITARWSLDNGRTWSKPVPLQASNNVDYQGVTVWEGGVTTVYDPASKRLVQMWLRQIKHAGLYHCFSYWRMSSDLGRSWTDPKMLRYEDGDEFEPKNPLLIAEVDETTAMLKKETVTVIDDRDPNKHSFGYQLSNFSLFENRETHEFELFLTTYGQQQNGAAWSTADCYHYFVSLKEKE